MKRGRGRRMDRRRHRRSLNICENCRGSPQIPKPPSKLAEMFNTVCCCLILGGLIATVFMLLDHHQCATCSSRCRLNSITQNLEGIATNLVQIQRNYQDLENKMLKLTKELPALEGQIEILEALATSFEQSPVPYKSKVKPPEKLAFTLPNIDGRLEDLDKTKNYFSTNTQRKIDEMALAVMPKTKNNSNNLMSKINELENHTKVKNIPINVY